MAVQFHLNVIVTAHLQYEEGPDLADAVLDNGKPMGE
jgi:hypothetical protein